MDDIHVYEYWLVGLGTGGGTVHGYTRWASRSCDMSVSR